MRELLERGMQAHYEDVLADIRARDARDFGREVAPLRQAADAILLDTSDFDVDEAIAEALRLVRRRSKPERLYCAVAAVAMTAFVAPGVSSP